MLLSGYSGVEVKSGDNMPIEHCFKKDSYLPLKSIFVFIRTEKKQVKIFLSTEYEMLRFLITIGMNATSSLS